MTIQPRLTQKGAFLVVGMRVTTIPMAGEILALWQTFVPRIDEVPDISELYVSYGVMQNFDELKCTLDYTAAVSVLSAKQLPDQMVVMEIPTNTYAVFECTLQTIGDVFGHIYNSWLPQSSYEQVGKAPYFERYGAAFNPADPTSMIEIFIPVKAHAR